MSSCAVTNTIFLLSWHGNKIDLNLIGCGKYILHQKYEQ